MEMTLTGIRPLPKSSSRNAIYLNDEFAFVLYKGELASYGLEEGMTVDDALYSRIMEETVFPRARKRGMNLLKTMDRTEADVRRKLTEGGYPEEACDNAIEYLRSYHYLDDDRYASEYVRCKSSSMSRRQITAKLIEKGVSKDKIERAFSLYDEENGTDGDEAESELIRRLIAKRCPAGVDSLDYDGVQKLRAYLYGKGFSVGKIDACLKELRFT